MGDTFKDKGIVVREFPAGEKDKRLTLLLLEHGRTTVFAKGAGGPKSKFHASAQIFAFSDFVFYQGAGFVTLAQSSLVTNFSGAHRDFERLCLSSHVLELAERMIMPGTSCADELRLIYLALSKLAAPDTGIKQARVAAAAYELRFYKLAGFAPPISHCRVCGGGVEGGGRFAQSGMHCAACAKKIGSENNTPVSPETAAALNYILNASVKDIMQTSVSPESAVELSLVTEAFRPAVLDTPSKSLGLLNAYS